MLGIISIGAVYSGSNPAAHESEIRTQAHNSEAKLIITDMKTCKKVEALGLPVVVVAKDVPNSYMSLFEADGSLAPQVHLNLQNAAYIRL